jgi:integrase
MRTIRDARLESRAARLRLAAQRQPHWKTLVPARLHLGYRRRQRNLPGTWLVRHYVGGERYRVAPLGLADDFHDAADGVIDFAEAQRRALTHKLSTGTRAGGPTVGDAIERYIEALRSDRPAAADEIEARIERSVPSKLSSISLAALSSDDLTRWRDALVSVSAYGSRAPSTPERKRQRRATANRTFSVLRAALNKAFEDGLVDSGKAWQRIKPLRNTTGVRLRFLTVEESQRLLNAADRASGFRDLVHAALLTGARYGELCRLQVRSFQHGKLHVALSKSGRGRHVVLTEEGIKFFSQLAVGRRGDDVLLRRNGSGEWRKSDQARLMVSAVKAARLAPITFHSLRHTYAAISRRPTSTTRSGRQRRASAWSRRATSRCLGRRRRKLCCLRSKLD